MQMLPGLLTFPTTGVGTTSNPVTVTITSPAIGHACRSETGRLIGIQTRDQHLRAVAGSGRELYGRRSLRSRRCGGPDRRPDADQQ